MMVAFLSEDRSVEELQRIMSDDSHVVGHCELHDEPVNQGTFEYKGCWTCWQHFRWEDWIYISVKEAASARAGRPVEYNPECDLRALMLRQLEQIPYVKDLVKRLRRSRDMRLACGYDRNVPTEAHFSQMKKRIGVEGFRSIEAWLRYARAHWRRLQNHVFPYIIHYVYGRHRAH